MKYRLEARPRPVFDDWLDEHGFEIVVKERSNDLVKDMKLLRYYASIEGIEIMGDGTLTSIHGNGDTPEIAVEDLALRLNGERIACHAWSDDRQEYDVPDEWSKI